MDFWAFQPPTSLPILAPDSVTRDTSEMRRRSPHLWTERKIRLRERSGAGQGFGVDYTPWVTIHDFSSGGRTHRVRGTTVDRMHQLFSDGESRAFMLFDWDDRVIDIREQFPLPRHQTYRIAATLGVRHPTTVDGTPNVMTTDFLLTLADGRTIARAYKPSTRLENPRICQKLGIEEGYWASRGIEWKVITENNVNRTLHDNINFIRRAYYVDGLEQPYPGAIHDACDELIALLPLYPEIDLGEACHRVANNHPDFELQFVFAAAKHLIARKVLRTDMVHPQPFAKRPLASFALKAPWNAINGTM